MYMGMKVKTSGVCMQHHCHADLCPQVFRVHPEVFQGAGNALEQESIHHFLIEPCQCAYSTESGHPVQTKPDSQSTGKRTPSPVISDTSVGA